MRHQLRDTTLRWLYKKYREERDALPESKKVGFRSWCRQYGILTPEREWEIRQRELPMKDTGLSEDDS